MSARGPELGVQIPGYDVGEQLGAGGFAVVRAGIAVATGDPVAIKIAKDPLLGDDDDLFAREIVIQRRFDHPNIVGVLDYGTIEQQGIHGSARYPFSVMPRATGSLSDLIRNSQGGKLPPKTVALAVSQIAAGLDAAHRARVLHRDVKPANVLILGGQNLEEDGRCALTDFGIAGTAHRLQTTRTMTRQLRAGTRGFTAQEQFCGQAIIPSDVYSLAGVGYFALAGVLPYNVRRVHGTEHGSDYYWRLLETPLEPIRRHVQMTEPLVAMEAVLAKGLTHDPASRHQSAGELADDLNEAYQAGLATQQKQRVTVDFRPRTNSGSKTWPFHDDRARRPGGHLTPTAVDCEESARRATMADGTIVDAGTTIGAHNRRPTVRSGATELDDGTTIGAHDRQLTVRARRPGERTRRDDNSTSSRGSEGVMAPRRPLPASDSRKTTATRHERRLSRGGTIATVGFIALLAANWGLGLGNSLLWGGDAATAKPSVTKTPTVAPEVTVPPNFSCRVTGVRNLGNANGEIDVVMSPPYYGNLLVASAQGGVGTAVSWGKIPSGSVDGNGAFSRSYNIGLSESLHYGPLTIAALQNQSDAYKLPEQALKSPRVNCTGRPNFGTWAKGDEKLE